MLKKVFKSATLRKGLQNSFFYSSASTIATAVNFAAFIYYSRELGPELYGVYNIVTSFISIFSIFSFTGINKVILREASIDESNINSVYNDSYLIRLIFIGATLAICYSSLIFTGYSDEVNRLILIFSFSILIQSFNLSLNSIIQARLRYKLISIFVVSEALALFLVAYILIALNFGVLAILMSQLLIPVVSAFVKYQYLKLNYNFEIQFGRRLNKKYFLQGLNFSLLNNLNVLSSKIDIFMLSFFTTEYMVGIYSVAFNLVSKVGVLRNTVVLSFFPLTAKKINSEGVNGRKLISYSLIISLPVLLGGYLFGFFAEDAIALLIGEQYIQSSTFLVLLIYRVGFDFLALPIGMALQASYNEKVNLIFASLRAFLNIVFNFWFFSIWGVVGIAYSTLITTVIVSLFIIFYGFYRLKKLGLLH